MNLRDYQPHREINPPRRCKHEGCEVLLSSVNETSCCWQHGGWIEFATWWDRSESFASLMAEESAAA